MTKPVISILQQVRTEAAREALQSSRANEHDAWFEEGRVDGWQEAEERRKWWGRLCFACGVATGVILHALVPA